VPVDITTETKQSYEIIIIIIIMCYIHYSVIGRLLLIRPDKRIFEVILIMKYNVLLTPIYIHIYTVYICTNVHVQNFSELVQPMNDHSQQFIKGLYTHSRRRDLTRKVRAEQ